MATEPLVPGSITQSADIGVPATAGALPAPGVKIVGEGDIQEQLVAWSNEFGTDPLTILKENNIKNSSDIRPGMMMDIPSGGAAAETSEEDTLLSQLTNLVSSSWDAITGGDSADPVTGGEEEIPGEEPGAVPDQDAEFEGSTGFDIDGEKIFIGPEGTGTALAPGAKVDSPVVTEAFATSDEGTPIIEGDNVLNLGAKPAIAEGSVSDPVSTPLAQSVSDIEPTENELATLISTLTPTSSGAAEIYNGVIANLKGIKFDNTEDAKELYQQLSEDAERETKKIDDSIAEIAEEKIKPTFSGWNKFMAILGAAMGAYGSAMTGTPNYALQVMNKAMDKDQEQFLASKEIRTKSLVLQRQAVIQRRSDLLQIGINEADKMLKVAQNQQDNQLQIANVQGIIDGLKNEAIEIDNKNKLAIIEIYTAKIAAQRLVSAAQTKDFRGRGVEPVTLKDGSGNLIEMPGYLAKTEAEAIKLRETSGFGSQIQDVLNKLDTLADETGDLPLSALGPKAISETRTKVAALTNELIIKLKDFYGMGANFTEYEQTLIQALTPTDAWFEKWKMWKVKSNNLRDTIVRTHKSKAAAQGAKFAQMPTGPKLGTGMKTGVSK